ncbi:hypothetical protein AB7M63_003586 [Bradyrhizobium japonicum]
MTAYSAREYTVWLARTKQAICHFKLGHWVESLHLLEALPGKFYDLVHNERQKHNPSERHAPRPNCAMRADAPRSTAHSDRIIHTTPKALKIASTTKPN